MGVMQAATDDGTATVSLTRAGNIRAVNLTFETMFGHSSSSVTGKAFKSLVTADGAASLAQVLEAVAAKGEDVERTYEAKHKSGSFFPISVQFTQEKTGQNGIIVKITALNDNVGMITIDDQGQIQSSNSFITRIFGWRSDELVSMNIAALMPRPYSRFHANYLATYRRSGVAKVVGDNRGRIVVGMRASPSPARPAPSPARSRRWRLSCACCDGCC